MTLSLMKLSRQQPLSDRSRWLAFFGVSLSLFLSITNGTSLNVALPALQQEMDAPFEHVQWVLLAFIFGTTVFMPLVGALGDAVDKRKLFTAGVAVFGIGALAGGLSPTLPMLVASRFVQGMGTAVISALAFAILAEVFDAAERGRAIGWSSGISTLAIICGPALGGAMLHFASWRWLFFLVVPAALALAIFVWRVLPASAAQKSPRLDVDGLLTSSGGLLACLLGLTWIPSRGLDAAVAALLLAGTALLLRFWRRLDRSPRPLVDPEVLRRPAVFAALGGEMAVFAATHSFFFLLPFLLENGLRLTPLQMGLVLMTNPFIQAAISPASGRLADRLGATPLTISGLLCLGGGFLAMTALDTQSGPLDVALCLVPVGLGVGLFVPANAAGMVQATPASSMASTTSALALSRRVAQAFGLALLTLLWTRQLGSQAETAPPAALLGAFDAILWLFPTLLIGGLALQILARRSSRGRSSISAIHRSLDPNTDPRPSGRRS